MAPPAIPNPTTSPAQPDHARELAQDAGDRELLRQAKAGDVEAVNQLIVDRQELIARIANKTRRKYPWIDADDLAQALSITVYRHIKRFDLRQKKNTWRKYSYFRLHGEAQQWLRELDPLGIKWPHRKPYPKHAHLGQLKPDGDGQAESFVPQATEDSLSLDLVDLFDQVRRRVDVDYDCLHAMIVEGMSVDQLCDEYMPIVAYETIAIAQPVLESQLLRKQGSPTLARWICDALKSILSNSYTLSDTDEESAQ